MLSTRQKAQILAKAEIAVAEIPSVRHQAGRAEPQDVGETLPEDGEAVARWKRSIEDLYATYVAARAAKSLREAEEAERMHQLRAANNRITRPQEGEPQGT